MISKATQKLFMVSFILSSPEKTKHTFCGVYKNNNFDYKLGHSNESVLFRQSVATAPFSKMKYAEKVRAKYGAV